MLGGISTGNPELGVVRVVFKPSTSCDVTVRVPSGDTLTVKITDKTTLMCAQYQAQRHGSAG